MPDGKVLQVAILIWGCVFCAIAALCIFLSSNYDREKRRYLILMESFHHPEQATDDNADSDDDFYDDVIAQSVLNWMEKD